MEPGDHAGHRRHRVRFVHRAARRDLEDQYVRLRRLGDRRLFWKRANATGALLSMAGGTLAYCACMAVGFKVADLHQIVIGIAVAGVLMLVGSLAGKQRKDANLAVFFPE